MGEDVKKEVAAQPQKFTYEQLEEIARNAASENQQLRTAVQQLNDARGLKRLEFLFNVVEHSIEFGPDITAKAVKEITEALFAPENPAEETKGDGKAE